MSNSTKQTCSIVGWVGNEPEVHEKGETIVAKLRIATDGGQTKDEKGEYKQLTTWLNMTAFNHDAKFCKEYIKKGDQIAFDCKIRNNDWTDDKGEKRYSFDFLGNNIIKLGKRDDKSSDDPLSDIS